MRHEVGGHVVPESRPFYKARGESCVDLSETSDITRRQDTIKTRLMQTLPYKESEISANVEEFFENLGLPKHYFESATDAEICTHVGSLIAAKEQARASGTPLDIHLRVEGPTTAFFASRSSILKKDKGRDITRVRMRTQNPTFAIERYIDYKYLAGGEYTRPDASITVPSKFQGHSASHSDHVSGVGEDQASSVLPTIFGWRMQCYRSKGVLSDGSHLRLYFLQKSQWAIEVGNVDVEIEGNPEDSGLDRRLAGDKVDQTAGTSKLPSTSMRRQDAGITPSSVRDAETSTDISNLSTTAVGSQSGWSTATSIAEGVVPGEAPSNIHYGAQNTTARNIEASATRTQGTKVGSSRLSGSVTTSDKGNTANGADDEAESVEWESSGSTPSGRLDQKKRKRVFRIPEIPPELLKHPYSKRIGKDTATMESPALAAQGIETPSETDLDKEGSMARLFWKLVHMESDANFLEQTSPELLLKYGEILHNVRKRMGAVIHAQVITDVSEGEDTDINPHLGHRELVKGIFLLVGYQAMTTHSFFSSFPDIYRWRGLYAVTKTCETFRNGVIVFSFRLRPILPFQMLGDVPHSNLGGRVRLSPPRDKAKKDGTIDTSSQNSPSKESQVSSLESLPPPYAFHTSQDSGHGRGPRLHRASMDSTFFQGIKSEPHMLLEAVSTRHAPGTLGDNVPHGVPDSLMRSGSKVTGGASSETGGLAVSGSVSSAKYTVAPPSLPLDTPEEMASLLYNRQMQYIEGVHGTNIEECMRDLVRDTSLHYVLPVTSLSSLLHEGLLSAQEVSYAYSAWKYTYHAISRSSDELSALMQLIQSSPGLSQDKTSALSTLTKLAKALKEQTFTESMILERILARPDLVAIAYEDFCRFHKPKVHTLRKEGLERSDSGPRFGAKSVVPLVVQFDSTEVSHNHGRKYSVYTPTAMSGALNKLHRGTKEKQEAPSFESYGAEGGESGSSVTTLDEDKGGFGGKKFTKKEAQTPRTTARSQLPLTFSEMKATIQKLTKGNEEDYAIFTTFASFNRHILRTNFFKKVKSSLTFRLTGEALTVPYGTGGKSAQDKPYGIYFFICGEGRGFHIRFGNIARGGIRLVKSPSQQAYTVNVSGVFEEAYSLALTQKRKNKDIVESGSKGVILLNLAHQDKARVAFEKYIDGILDLILPPESSGGASIPDVRHRIGRSVSPGFQARSSEVSSEELSFSSQAEIVDYLQEEEILFFGPDENTGEYMDWASQYARSRGYTYWKALTTGKSPKFGGIPHDMYGMTTRGVRTYQIGIKHKLGLWVPEARGHAMSKFLADVEEEEEVDIVGLPQDIGERSQEQLLSSRSEAGVSRKLRSSDLRFRKRVTKIQTGGPDGDLGSNEIKLSVASETYIAVIDGSGVLHDPDGIDGDELLRLANLRKPVSFFDKTKLGPDGYLVTTQDSNVRLPDGTIIASGIEFRNNAHLLPQFTADAFVPCGGRPNAVHMGNVQYFLYGGNSDGTIPRESPTAAGESPVSKTLRFRYIVEGANLFFSPDARLAIENAGIILFRDASANKGGVTSSSLEVLSALVLSDDQFDRNMCVKPQGKDTGCLDAGKMLLAPKLYEEYVKEVQKIIEINAFLEFECLWREKKRTGLPYTTLSDSLSTKIVNLAYKLGEEASLYENESFFTHVMEHAIPKTLRDFLKGYENVIAKLPETYRKALFSSFTASRFVYKYGLNPSDFAFFEFADGIMKGTMSIDDTSWINESGAGMSLTKQPSQTRATLTRERLSRENVQIMHAMAQ